MGYCKFLIKSATSLADAGAGDGTSYATFATATISVANKTFVLGTFTLRADMGADANDKINGYLLKFTSSGNVYHITDWDAATDKATVAETPDTADTGAGEVLVNVLEATQTAAFPARQATDWRPFTKWKGTSATAAELYFFLPNLIKDGGFEEQAAGNVGGDWTAESTDWQVSSTTPLLGSRMAVWDADADAYLTANLTATVKKGRTYVVAFKVQSVGANPSAGALSIRVRQKNSPNSDVDADFGGAGAWTPTVTTTAAWVSQEFVPDFDTDEAQLFVDGISANIGAATDIRVDEFYIWEKITPSRLVIQGHNLNGSENILARAAYCNPLRTSYSSDDYTEILASYDQDGTGLVYKTLTATARPVYHLSIPAESGKTHEAAIIAFCEALTFNKFLTDKSTPRGDLKTEMVDNVNREGQFIGANVEYIEREIMLEFESVLRTWIETNLLDSGLWTEYIGKMTPFYLVWDEDNYPSDIFLVRNDGGLEGDLGTGPSNVRDLKLKLRGVA